MLNPLGESANPLDEYPEAKLSMEEMGNVDDDKAINQDIAQSIKDTSDKTADQICQGTSSDMEK